MKSLKKIARILVLTLISTLASAQTYTALYNYPETSRNNTGVLFPMQMTQGRDGNLYGTIISDGTQNSGTVFKMTTTGTLTTVYNFCILASCADGRYPQGGVTLGTDGNLYGTTTNGGTKDEGTVFKLTPAGALTTFYNFTATNTDNGYPNFTPVLGQDGNFYGISQAVYNGQYGTFFKLTPAGAVTFPHDFAYSDGAVPNGAIQGTDGNYYGTTQLGGDATCHCGVVYKITSAGKITVLHAFKGGTADGYRPLGLLVQGNDGNFYGTTYQGGARNLGTVFKITPTGTFTLLYSFNPTSTRIDGDLPLTGLVLGTDGNFYGTTGNGGKTNTGVLYKITSAGVQTILYSFCAVSGCTDGIYPQTPLIQHTNGKFYGNTSGNSLGGGYFFSLDMGLKPFANLINWQGKVGKTVEILGQGFTSATTVSFNGTPATTVHVTNATYMTAVVPAGATTGFVTVTTGATNLKSNRKFLVTPAITTFTPTTGPVGTSVVITGTSFTGATRVAFNNTKATTVSVDSDTQITATVPAGATTGKIQITTPGGAATTTTNFTVTP